MIKHILKDGTVLQDIKGHVVRKEDAPVAYRILEQKGKERKHGKL